MFEPRVFIEKSVNEIRDKTKNEMVIAACSGGVDSTTVAVLAQRAVRNNLLAVFIDDGLRRENESNEVLRTLKNLGIRVRKINAEDEFFKALKGIRDAERKRKKFRKTFYSILGKVVKSEKARWLAQGTIKADVVETVGGIKTQHNVLEQIGINPGTYGFRLLEPLKELYKPQVRMVARELGLPEEVSEKMPFPGPGLAIRVLGEVTPERVKILRKATKIVEEETRRLKAFQSLAVLHEDKATGIKDGKRVYGDIITVRVVESDDGITARAMRVPYGLLKKISERVIDEIPSVVRCLFDMTDKPPATIEFE